MFRLIIAEHAIMVCAGKQKSLLETTVNYCTAFNHAERQFMKPDLHNILYIYTVFHYANIS